MHISRIIGSESKKTAFRILPTVKSWFSPEKACLIRAEIDLKPMAVFRKYDMEFLFERRG